MTDWVVSLMERKDIPDVARALSVAMCSNPLHAAVFQGRDENARRLAEQAFLELFTETPEVTFLARSAGGILGVMRMKSCEGRRPPADVPGAGLETLSARKAVWHTVWARHDPKNPHWHLGPVGVLPEHQRRGIGTDLMRRFCREIDACGSSAYLETDRPENVAFYRKFGFEVAGTEDILGAGNFFMTRAAARAFP